MDDELRELLSRTSGITPDYIRTAQQCDYICVTKDCDRQCSCVLGEPHTHTCPECDAYPPNQLT